MKAKIRGTEIYFDVAGMHLAPTKTGLEERPILFMLHGGPGGDHSRFKYTSLALQETAQLIFIDHRGCGQSKKTKASDYTLENNIEDIEALRKHLGLERICLLGASYGGIVAQGYAIRYPHRVEKLILVVTSPSHHGFHESKAILNERGTPQQIKVTEKLWEGNFKNAKEVGHFFQIMETMYCETSRKKSTKKLIPSTGWSHEALNQGFGGFLRTFNFLPKLNKITCPTLILAGDKDWICPPSQSKLLAKHIPHAKLKIFKNCGHSIAVDANAKYLKSIQSFLGNHHGKTRRKR